jgi:hypothetical protein
MDTSDFAIIALVVFALLVLVALLRGHKLKSLQISEYMRATFGTESASLQIIVMLTRRDPIAQAHTRLYLDGRLSANLYVNEGRQEIAVEQVPIERTGEYQYVIEMTGVQRLYDENNNLVPLNFTARGEGLIPLATTKRYEIAEVWILGPQGAERNLELWEYGRRNATRMPHDVAQKLIDQEIDRY